MRNEKAYSFPYDTIPLLVVQLMTGKPAALGYGVH